MLLLIAGIFWILIASPFSKNPESPLSGQVEPIQPITQSQTLMKQTDENVVSKDASLQLTSTVVVDVKGQVALPGVYTLSANKRVLDAITLAGGLLPTADERMLNLAAKLVDEMVIYVPTEGEHTSFTGPIIQVPGATSDSDLININTSDENELMTLSGIGPSKAKAITIYREENGLFQSIEQLKEVSGIGDQTFEAIKDFISIN